MSGKNLSNVNPKTPENKPNRLWQQQIIEALLFSSDQPITTAELAKNSNLTLARIREIIKDLNMLYQKNGHCFFIHHKTATLSGNNNKNVALIKNDTPNPAEESWQMRTLPELGSWLKNSHSAKLMAISPKAMETLTIIAYRQPITKTKIDKIRNADSGYIISILLKKNLIKMRRLNKVAGRPLSYHTTDLFLSMFGFESLNDLPNTKELDSIIEV